MGHYLVCVCLFKHAAFFQLCSVLSLPCMCYPHQESEVCCAFWDLLVFFSVEARLPFRCTFELELLSKALYIQSSICPWVHLLFVIHHSSVVKRAFSRLEGLSSISASDTRRTQWRICSSFVHLISLDLFVVHIDVVYTVVCFVLSLIISFLFLFNQWLFTCLQ